MSHAFALNYRQLSLFGAVALAFVVLAGRLTYLQVIGREQLMAHIEQARDTVRELPARRGDILDAHGNIQATSHPVYQVGVDPQSLTQQDWDNFPEIAAVLEMTPAQVVEAFSRTETQAGTAVRWVKLADALEPDAYAQLQALSSGAVYGNLYHRRHYPGHDSGAHFIGMLNKEDQPLGGVEQSFDFFLRGQDGWIETEKDGRGRELAQFRHRAVAPRNGYHVQLTLDQVIQDIVQAELNKLVENTAPDGVSILVSEVDTGALLAGAVYPSFDPNTYWEYPIAHQRNRAIADIYEPGSTFKAVTAAAVLEEQLVALEDAFRTDAMRVDYNGVNIRMPREYNGKIYPQLTVRQMVVKSSNRGTALLGMMLGEEAMYRWARKFGYGQTTGIQIYGEENGILLPPERWDGFTISRLPIGHAIAATPMQVHTAMGTIANGGVRMRPQLVRRILDDEGRTVSRIVPEELGRVISDHTARLMAELLEDVVNDGTGKRARPESFTAAGKTGTSEKIDPQTGAYLKNANVASFSGFLPAQRPEIVITVVVDNPTAGDGDTGGVVAAPVFQALGQRIGQYLGISRDPAPSLPLALMQTEAVP